MSQPTRSFIFSSSSQSTSISRIRRVGRQNYILLICLISLNLQILSVNAFKSRLRVKFSPSEFYSESSSSSSIDSDTETESESSLEFLNVGNSAVSNLDRNDIDGLPWDYNYGWNGDGNIAGVRNRNEIDPVRERQGLGSGNGNSVLLKGLRADSLGSGKLNSVETKVGELGGNEVWNEVLVSHGGQKSEELGTFEDASKIDSKSSWFRFGDVLSKIGALFTFQQESKFKDKLVEEEDVADSWFLTDLDPQKEFNLLSESERLLADGNTTVSPSTAPANNEGDGDISRDRLWGIIGFSLLALFIVLSVLMFYSNSFFDNRGKIGNAKSKRTREKEKEQSEGGFKAEMNAEAVSSNTAERHAFARNARQNSKMSNFRSSMSSIFSRERLSTWSGRYSGKLEALPGKDDHIENYLREARHQNNNTGASNANSKLDGADGITRDSLGGASVGGTGKLKKKNRGGKGGKGKGNSSLYNIPNQKKRRVNKANNANWESSSLQEMDKEVIASAKGSVSSDKDPNNTDNESDI